VGQPRPINLQEVRGGPFVISVFRDGSTLDRGMVGQILKSQTPELLLDQSLGWIAMEVEIPKVPEDLRDTLARLLDGAFV
jgi:hypothetical protein